MGNKVDKEVFRSVNQIIWSLQWHSCELVHCGGKALFFARWGHFFFSMASNRSNNEA